MKIPYVVNKNTLKTYATPEAMSNSVAEANRKIRAEDFKWDTTFTPAPLTFCAALMLSRLFDRLNPLQKILQKDVDMLMDLYPSTIQLKFSVPYIKDEQYWKRSFRSKYPSRVELGKIFWKGKFLSACLQDYLESANPDVFREDEAVELASLVSPYIFFLGLSQLQIVRQPPPALPSEMTVEDTCEYSVTKVYDHIPMEPVLAKLYNLREISLVFGINNLHDKYLTSNLDCSKVKLILQHLVKKESIEELDFNHCQIGNYGMKALGGFIFLHNNVKVIRIANNRFEEQGIQGVAYALQMKPAAPIELLDFSLNPMSLECATMFAAAFVRCKEKPQTLIVNSCGFSGASAEKMAGLLVLNRGLTRLDMAANDLSGEAEKTLIRALERNKKILKMDLRLTKISEEGQAKVEELLLRNKNLVGEETEPSDDIPPLYLNEPEYLIWEYNPNNPDYIPGRYPSRVPEV
ncbi:hypothetical protein PYW07_007256 [Mythimna separata]|uniref:Uncharacterized protein n=1 Tax=Mythimna separata TaxID=271217 RepID=A0AAD7Z2N9_MYTSE|nr:hypothetical protein PYW07_007256 [Mythimna separata]